MFAPSSSFVVGGFGGGSWCICGAVWWALFSRRLISMLIFWILSDSWDCSSFRFLRFSSYVLLSSLFSTGLSMAFWISSIRLKHSSFSCSAASIIPVLSWARLIYVVIWNCVDVSNVLSESWNVSWWESLYDGELFVSGCLTGSLLGVLCPIGTGVNFATILFPGWNFLGVSLEL